MYLEVSAIKSWIDVLASVVAIFGGIVTGMWAYTRYVLERGLLPPVYFYVELKKIGIHKDKKILEILLHLKNNGDYTLVATNIRLDLRYIDSSDSQLEYFHSVDDPKIGKLVFPHSLRSEINIPKIPPKKPSTQIEKRGIPLNGYDTFIQPGIDQPHPFQTAVPLSTSFVLVWASFEYAQRPSLLQKFILNLSRRLGLIQYSLSHITNPHTVESVFDIQ